MSLETNASTRSLIIIDLQNEFLAQDGRYPILESSKEALLTNLTSLVPEFRKGGHIIWVKSEYDHRRASSDEPLSTHEGRNSRLKDRDAFLSGTHKGQSPCCDAGSMQAEIYPAASALIADADTIITKTYYSAFKGTSLLSTLRARGITDIYFCGLLSNTCVLATLIDAVQIEGFKVHSVWDVLGWRKNASHSDALRRMQDMGVDIVGSNTACIPNVGDRALSIPELYYVNGSIPSWRVQIALYEKGIEVKQIRLKVMTYPKPTRIPAFLSLNHRGKTPVLIDNDEERTTVNESLAILVYLETYYPMPALLPPIESRKYRARILSLLQETENLHNAYDALEDAFFEARASNSMEAFVSSIRPALVKDLFKELDFWETYASKSARYIGGGIEFSLADCALYPILGYMLRRGFEFDERWPALKIYFDNVWERESVKSAQPEGWTGTGKTDVFRGT